MRYPFQVIKEWQIPLTPLPKTYPATAAFLELMVTLDELFDEFPACCACRRAPPSPCCTGTWCTVTRIF